MESLPRDDEWTVQHPRTGDAGALDEFVGRIPEVTAADVSRGRSDVAQFVDAGGDRVGGLVRERTT